MNEETGGVKPDVEISQKHLHILQHSLGVDTYGHGRQYRNHFATDPTTPDGALCRGLVELGLMRDNGPVELAGGMHYYCVTRPGKSVVAEQSATPPKTTRSQRRYQKYLNTECGETFGEWLKRGVA